MASSKAMPSSNSRNSDLSRRTSSSASYSSSTKTRRQRYQHRHQQQSLSGQTSNNQTKKFASTMTVDGILRNVYNANPPTESTLLDASITLIEAPAPTPAATATDINQSQNHTSGNSMNVTAGKSVDEVWREIVSGERKEMKQEAPDEMMTLEDFLAKAGAVEDAAAASEEMDVKLAPQRLSGGVYTFDPAPSRAFPVEGSIIGFGNGVEMIGATGRGAVAGGGGGRGKRTRLMVEPLDKAAQQRQRRMIKNRESAARSRERKQAYQVELESLAVRLEEENEMLLKEKAERTKERLKQLMENVIPIVEKQRVPRVLRRVRSLQW